MEGALPVIAGYRVIAEIGSGGIGVVYLAQRAGAPSTRVALKVLHASTSFHEKEVRRLLREARVGQRLTHAHILPVLAIESWRGQPVLVMDYVEGSPLSRWQAGPEERERSLGEKLLVLASVADALQHAHDQHVIHRDVKPANILVRTDGHPFLIDFGMARTLGVDSTITASGTVLGTPGYLAPEVLSGRFQLDFRTDVYALGVSLFEVATGRLPFQADSLPQLFDCIQNHEPPTVREFAPHAPASLETIVARSLEKRPRDRYPSAAAVRDDLRRAAMGLKPRAGRMSLWVNRELRSLRRGRMRIAGAIVGCLLLLLSAVVWGFAEVRAELHAKDVRDALAEGYRRLDRGQLEDALAAFGRAEELDASDWRAPLARADAYAEFMMLGRAREAIDEALHEGYDYGADAPTAEDAFHRAVVAYAEWDLARSRTELERALEIDPQYYRASMLLELVYRRADRPDDARRALATCRKNLKEVDPRHALVGARLAELDGRFGDAIGLLEELADSDRCPGWIHSSLGVTYLTAFRQGGRLREHLARGIEECRKAVEFEPEDGFAWSNLAVGTYLDGDRESARSHAERALACDPLQEGASRILAVLAAERRDWEEAQRRLSAIRPLAESQAEVARFQADVDYSIGTEAYQAGRMPEAIAALSRCVARNPAHLAGRFALANARWRAGDGEGAVAGFREVLARWRESPARPSADSWQEPWHRECALTRRDYELDVHVGLLVALSKLTRPPTAEERRAGLASLELLRARLVDEKSLGSVAAINLAEALVLVDDPELRDNAWACELVDQFDLRTVFAGNTEARAMLEEIESGCP